MGVTKPYRFRWCVDTHGPKTYNLAVFKMCLKGASCAKDSSRIAAPHFEMCFGHGWANFNIKYV